MRGGILFILALMVGAGCADAPGEPAAAGADVEPVETGCARGVVTDSELRPLPGVMVAGGDANATTAADGAFALCGLAAGSHEVTFAKSGYVVRNVTVDVPADGPVVVELARVPADERRVEALPFTLHYSFGYATWDATLGRQGVNASTCDPCTFDFTIADVPDIIYLEADWTRSFIPPEGARDLMYHVFRAGAPFDEGADLGSGAKEKPFAFNYRHHEIVNNGNADNEDGTYSFSGLVACDGNAPCIDQRIDVWVSLFYDYARVPAAYTAVAAPP